ncbi:MAG: hypothetical protein ACRDS1_15065 [Pseudonocardiaceae bacterium]
MVPLLPRSKPVCRSLTERLDRVRRQADLASQHTEDSLGRAAEAHNLAALIVSDCGMPALARCPLPCRPLVRGTAPS